MQLVFDTEVQTNRICGAPSGDDALLLIDPQTGAGVRPDGLRMHLGRARLTRTSLEANGSICQGMLRHRYGRGEEDQ